MSIVQIKAKTNDGFEPFKPLGEEDLWGLRRLERDNIHPEKSFLDRNGKVCVSLGSLSDYANQTFDGKDYNISSHFESMMKKVGRIPDDVGLYVIVHGKYVVYALEYNGTFYKEESDILTKRTLIHLLHSHQDNLYTKLKNTYNTFLEDVQELLQIKLRDIIKSKYSIKGELVYDEFCGDTYTQVYKPDPNKPISNDNIAIVSMDKWYESI